MQLEFIKATLTPIDRIISKSLSKRKYSALCLHSAYLKQKPNVTNEPRETKRDKQTTNWRQGETLINISATSAKREYLLPL